MHVCRFGPEDGSPVLLLHGGGVAGWMWLSLRRSLESKFRVLVVRVMVVSAQAKAMPSTGLTLRALGAAAPLAGNRRFARMQARELFVPPELMEEYFETSALITKAALLAAVGDNLRFELPVAWSGFRGQTLVMVGRRERALMRDSAAAIHTALPGSEIELVDGCRPGIPLERPDWFNGRVADWLSPQQPKPSSGIVALQPSFVSNHDCGELFPGAARKYRYRLRDCPTESSAYGRMTRVACSVWMNYESLQKDCVGGIGDSAGSCISSWRCSGVPWAVAEVS